MILALILSLILLLFATVETSRVSVAIKQAKYDDAYTISNTVAITCGILSLLSLIMVIASIYLKFRPTALAAAAISH